MRLSYKIPIITGATLLSTIAVNILAFKFFSEGLFVTYTTEANKQTITTPDPNLLKAFTELGKLDPKTRQDYVNALSDLSQLSDSLQNLSQNINLYVGTGSINGEIFQIPEATKPTHNTTRILIENIFNFSSYSYKTPEGRFVIGLLQRMFILNFFWLFIVSVLYGMWIRRVFRPVGFATTQLDHITNEGSFHSVRYHKDDEFQPLIRKINNLHKTLSIQAQIRKNFLSDLSHEIRTPITAVKCYLEGIEDGVIEVDQKNISHLQDELSRLTSITEQIMEYENLTNDTFQDVKVETFDPTKLLDNIITSYESQLLRLGQEIQNHIPHSIKISMDKGMFIQICHNILSNFIKYAGPESTLKIYFERNRNEYHFVFEDDGKGIPEEEIHLVKEKFYRVDKARTQSDKSMGIGLSIIDRIAKLHNGYLIVENRVPHGVKISITIGR